MTISNQGIALSFTRETNQSCDKFPCARLVAVNNRSSFRLGYPASTNSLPPPFWMIALQKSENDDGDNTGRYYDTSYGKDGGQEFFLRARFLLKIVDTGRRRLEFFE